MAHVYCGDPDIIFSQDLIEALKENIDILELGIPYSDPLADGEIFRKACVRALQGETKVDDVFHLANKLGKDGFAPPIVLTPSVDDTKTGSLIPSRLRATWAAKPPTPDKTSGV